MKTLTQDELDQRVRRLKLHIGGILIPERAYNRLIENYNLIHNLDENDKIVMDPFLVSIFSKIGAISERTKKNLVEWAHGVCRPIPPIRTKEEMEKLLAKAQRYIGRWMYLYEKNGYAKIAGVRSTVINQVLVGYEAARTVHDFPNGADFKKSKDFGKINIGTWIKTGKISSQITKIVVNEKGVILVVTRAGTSVPVVEIIIPNNPKAKQRQLGVKI